MNNIDKIIIINLDKDVERMSNCINQLKKYNITNYERYSAIYGSKLSKDEINSFTTNIGKLIASYSIIGCGISHINIWKKIVKNGIKKTLILEDDFILKDDFLNKFNTVINKSPNFYDIIFLTANITHNNNIKLYDIDENYYKQFIISQTLGYVITLKGAQKLLKYINKVSYHIDAEICIQSLIRNDLNIISLKEPLLYQSYNISYNKNDRHFPLILNDILYDKDINYHYKTTLFSFINYNVSINSLVIILLGFLNFQASIIILLIEYFYFTNNENNYILMYGNIILLLIGYLLKLFINCFN